MHVRRRGVTVLANAVVGCTDRIELEVALGNAEPLVIAVPTAE